MGTTDAVHDGRPLARVLLLARCPLDVKPTMKLTCPRDLRRARGRHAVRGVRSLTPRRGHRGHTPLLRALVAPPRNLFSLLRGNGRSTHATKDASSLLDP